MRLGGVFGALRDSGPDYGGRRVIEKHAGKSVLGEVDYLLESPDDRADALSFGLGQQPPAPRRAFNKTLDLAKLQKIADDIVRGEFGEKTPILSTPKSSYGLERRRAPRGQKQSSRINKDCGSPNSTARTIAGTLPRSRTPGSLSQRSPELISAAESPLVQVDGKDVLLVHRFDRSKTEKGYARA